MVVVNEFDTVYAPADTAIDDSGAEHDSVQAAVDNASSWVLVGPGTFSENVSITTKDLTMIGCGEATVIDGTDQGTGLELDAGQISVERLSVRTDNAGNAHDAIEILGGNQNAKLSHVTVKDADRYGFQVRGQNHEFYNVEVLAADEVGMRFTSSGHQATGVSVAGGDDRAGIEITGIDTIVVNAVIRGNAAIPKGVSVTNDRNTFVGCRVINTTDWGVDLGGQHSAIGHVTTRDCENGVRVQGTDNRLVDVTTVNTTTTAFDHASATTPRFTEVFADGSPVVTADADWVARLVNSPNASIANAVLDNGDSAEVSVPVPDGETLKVYRWGAYQITDGATPTDLDVELKDGSDTVQATANTGDNESTDPASPVASHANSSGSTSIFKLAVANDTGGSISDPGVGAFFAYIVE